MLMLSVPPYTHTHTHTHTYTHTPYTHLTHTHIHTPHTHRHVYGLRQLSEELERYKELAVTYEQSISRKDHVIANLTRALQKQVPSN